jgi:quercetin dioxygenase-like cupin family protein
MSPELIEDPVFRYHLRLSSSGDTLIGEFWVEPGGGGKIEHIHPPVEERFHLLEGKLTHRADGSSHEAGAGERFTVPVGVRHAFQNTGSLIAHIRVEMEPALLIGDLLRDAAALGRAGRWAAVGRRGIPKGPRALVEMAELLDSYRDTIALSSPPRWLRRIGVPPLARLQRRRKRRR